MIFNINIVNISAIDIGHLNPDIRPIL